MQFRQGRSISRWRPERGLMAFLIWCDDHGNAKGTRECPFRVQLRSRAHNWAVRFTLKNRRASRACQVRKVHKAQSRCAPARFAGARVERPVAG
jgi:hypothetical protein